jgi:meso-butanediol dehydrogenase/(S,S)-butanediol dehydrogenase/diacetyl reductase
MKVALISGASGGIGSETVKRFIKDGYFTIGIYNTDKTAIDNLINELKKDALEGYFFGVQADFCNAESIDNAIETIKANFNHIDVLVNNAGVSLYKLAYETSIDEWDKTFDVNVKSAFRLIKAFLPTMIERQHGSIVNVSSVWGVVAGAFVLPGLQSGTRLYKRTASGSDLGLRICGRHKNG